MGKFNFNDHETVEFGSYPYYADGSKKAIKWLVLEHYDDGSLLLLSADCIDVKQYNDNEKNTSWKNCSLRKWLNEVFYDKAFNDKEKKNILLSELTTKDKEITKDKVFLLSIDEAAKYFKIDYYRKAFPTPYAEREGKWNSKEFSRWWWLRSSESPRNTVVRYNGEIKSQKRLPTDDSGAVRAAIKVNNGAVVILKQSEQRDFFLLAQQSENEEKDLQKTILYYEKAIENNQQKNASIHRLYKIYKDIGMYEDARKVLNTYKRFFYNYKTLYPELDPQKTENEKGDTYKEIIPFIQHKINEIKEDSNIPDKNYEDIKKEIETIKNNSYLNSEQKNNAFFLGTKRIEKIIYYLTHDTSNTFASSVANFSVPILVNVFLSALFKNKFSRFFNTLIPVFLGIKHAKEKKQSKEREKILKELEEIRLSFIAEGSLAYADHILNNPYKYTDDTARYIYSQAILIYSSVYNKLWCEATLQYFKTYFSPIGKIEIDNKNSNFKNFFLTNIRNLFEHNFTQIIPEQKNDLKIGIFEFIKYYNNDKGIEQEMLSLLSKYFGSTANWVKEINFYYNKLDRFIEFLKQIHLNPFDKRKLKKSIEDGSNVFLNKTDATYVKSVVAFLSEVDNYSESQEHDKKKDFLDEANNILKNLISEINKFPTRISYEKILPELYRFQVEIKKETEALYAGASPEIQIELKDDAVFDPNSKEVAVPLSIFNAHGCQKARNMSLSISADSDIVPLNTSSIPKFDIAGGQSKNEVINVKVSDTIVKDQEFSLQIKAKYQFKKDLSDDKQAEANTIIQVSIKKDLEFKEIENVFSYYGEQAIEDEKMFYGRKKETEYIISKINRNKKGGISIALYGQTRAGKSSLLYHLENRLRQNSNNIIVNIGSIGDQDLSKDISEFLYTLLDGLKSEVNKYHQDVAKLLKEANIELNADKLLENRESSQILFNSVFKKFCSIVSGKYNVIVMIDEFTYIYDWIRQGIMTDRIMKFWKAFIQNNGIFAIIVGQDHMMRFFNNPRFTNDFGTTDKIKVTYLAEVDAKKMMYEPIRFTNTKGEKENRYKGKSLDRIYELTAGSAYLIMNLCSRLVKYLNEIKSNYITEGLVNDFLDKKLTEFIEEYFEPLFVDKDQLSSKESTQRNKELLKKIAQNIYSNSGWAAISSVINSEEEQKTFDKLVERDVVIVDEKNNRCKIKVVLYKEWLLKKYGSNL